MSDTDEGLARAAAVFLQRAEQPDPEPVAAFLARHADLRAWLEPMLGVEPGDAAVAAGSTTVGPWLLRREIGRGGMGVVHEAQRAEGDGPIALKLLSGFRALHPTAVERFRREAALTAKLRHPGLVRVLDSGTDGDVPWLAMEFVAGAPLDAVLQDLAGRDPATLTADDLGRAVLARQHVPSGARSGTPTTTTFAGSYTAAVVAVAIRLADALAHLHDAGVIHRDVKPSNVLLTADGRVVLTDLGLARDTAAPSLTMTGDFAGTPNYVSPEQAMAKRVSVDHRSDLFAFGSTLYELLTLAKAFPGDSLPEVLGRILAKEPVPASRLHRGLAPDLEAVLGRLLEKDPDRRYPDAHAVLADLRAFLAYRPVAAVRVSPLRRLVKWTRREPLRAALFGVLAVSVPAVTAAAGYVWARGDEIRAGREQLLAQQVNDLVDAGHVAALQEDRTTAHERFDAALALDPANQEAATGLVFSVLRRDGTAAADQLLESRIAPTMPPGLLELLRYAVRHRTGEAGRTAADLPAPRGAIELFVTGLLDLDTGPRSLRSMLAHLERAVLASDRPRLWLHAYWAIHADLVPDLASCQRCAETLLATWPDSPVARYFACLALRRVDADRALASARAALAQHPDDGLLHWAESTVLESRGDAAGAIDAMERAVARLPTAPAAHYSLGRLRYERGEHGKALPAMVRARDLAPNFAEAWMGIGMAQRHLGKPDEALTALRHAVGLNESFADARFQLGQQLVQGGEVAEGLVELRRAAETAMNDPNKWHHVAFAAFTTGDDATGDAALRRAIEVRPEYERGHLVLVMYLQERGKPADVRAALAAWVQALPASVEGWLQYGRHCLRADLDAELRDAATAAWAAGRVLALTGDASGAGWLLLGEARSALGQRDAARTALQRAVTAPRALSTDERLRCDALLASLEGPK